MSGTRDVEQGEQEIHSLPVAWGRIDRTKNARRTRTMPQGALEARGVLGGRESAPTRNPTDLAN